MGPFCFFAVAGGHLREWPTSPLLGDLEISHCVLGFRHDSAVAW